MGMQVIEIGKGSKVKYELDKKTGLIKVTCISSANLPHMYSFQTWIADRACLCRLIVFFTHQLCILTTMDSSLVLSVRIMTPWMCLSSCRLVWLSLFFFLLDFTFFSPTVVLRLCVIHWLFGDLKVDDHL